MDKEQGFAITMALRLWEDDYGWMLDNAPKWGQYSWEWRQRKLGHLQSTGPTLTPAEAMRKHRAKHKDDPVHRFKRLATRYIKEGRTEALQALWEAKPEGVQLYAQAKVLRALGRNEEADAIDKAIAEDRERRFAEFKAFMARR